MKRKILTWSIVFIAFIGLGFLVSLTIPQNTHAYVAGKKACASFYWSGKKVTYKGGSPTTTDITSAGGKAKTAVRYTICTSKVDKNGVINGKITTKGYGDDGDVIIIKNFAPPAGSKLGVVNFQERNKLINGASGNVDYEIGKTSFKEFIIKLHGEIMSKPGLKEKVIDKTKSSTTSSNTNGGHKSTYTMLDRIYWNPSMDKEGETKAVTTDGNGNIPGQDSDATDKSGESDDADPCYSGAGVLGHVLCPILKNFGELADSAYVNWIQPNLIIEPELLSDDENGTFAGWQIFQNFANIAFIIMLLVVILSQVTGVGLSNYGIKKTLPKLIVAAVLINVSYIICQLAVDLSNVLGVGLKSLMDGLTEQLQTDLTVNEVVFNADAKTGISGWQVGDTVAALAILAGIIAGAGTLLAQGMAVLLPLLLGAIAVAIGILFFFFLLSVRKAGVVLLVVLSPIAFVCYMLPNTKKLFDRWIKAFSGLLLLFPICGLIIGGGDFASTILLNVNASDDGKIDFFFALTAMIVGIAPIFFIPLLLRNSMSALGKVGDRISKRGRDISGGINKRIRDSDAYNSRRARWAAGRDGGLRSRIASSRVGRHLPGSAQLARNRATYAGMMKQQSAQDRALQSDYLSGVREDIKAEEFKAELQARENKISNSDEFNDLGALQRGLETALKRSDKMGIRAYQNVLSSKGENGRDAVHDAMVNAQRSGPVSAEAAQTYAANIMNNHAADYKNSNRSTFDYANNVQNLNKETKTENVPQMNDFSAISAGSLKAENLPGTDDGELGRYVTALENGKISEADAADLRAITNEALSNENIRGSIKGKQLRRIELINHLAGLRTGEIAGPPAPPPPSPLEGDTGPLH